MSSLADFLLARIAEDKETAQAATQGAWRAIGGARIAADHELVAQDVSIYDNDHITRWDPARVLAECEAKRLLVERVGNPDWAGFRLLALPYADHPDYREEWRL